MSDPSKWGSQTSMPWKEWFLTSGFRGYTRSYLHTVGQLDWDVAALQAEWEDVHNTGMILGKDRVGGAYDGYHPIFKPVADDFILDEVNLNEICTVGIHFSLAEYQRVSTSERMQISGLDPLLDPSEIVWDRVTGQRYDGVNVWSAFPPSSGTGLFVGVILQGDNAVGNVYFTDLPNEYYAYTYTRDAGGVVLYWFNNHQYRDAIFRNGWNLVCGNFYYPVTGWTYKVAEKDLFSVGIQRIKIYYMNAITNSLSRYWMKTTGGVDVDLNGLAFTIPEADLVDYTAGASNWSHITDKIYFIGREGQGTYTLNYAGGFGDFQQTNTRIIIPTMPPMNRGTYEIKLEQFDFERGNGNPYTCYCGDWRSRDTGEIYPGSRLIFVVSDEKIPKKPPTPYFKWGWKYGDLTIWERYAPIDVRATEYIWEGRVGSVSGLRRAIDDQSGLYSGSDAEVDLLQGSDKHFSKMLAQYTCKGQVAEISHGWGEEPEGWHEVAFYGVVEDYSLKGPKFHAKLKDLSSLYFNGQLPRNMITNEEFPNADEDALGRGIPEILGEHSLTTGTNPGAIEAICVDGNLHKYIQAGGPLHSTPAVYSEGVVVNPALYAIIVEPDGRQYIQFTNDQGDNKITFNCTGYFFGPWNSANGYIESPAYIISFLWAMLMEIPVNFIDFESVNALADLFDDSGWGESGRVAITALESKEEVMKKILYSFGINFWQTRDGYFRLGRKDISNLEPAKQLFAQIDLFDHPDRKYNLQDLFNSVKARWNYYPAPESWGGAIQREDPSSINWFGSVFMVEEPWDLYWNSDEDFVNQRILEELIKLAYGYKKAEVTVPMDYINELDIFDNVKVQDPFAPSADGSGESGRYYYITGIDYEWESQSLRLELVDLHWLLQQYFIFGDEDVMPDLWTNAGDYYRLYGYLCDENTWEFSDGFPGKILIDENLISED